MGVAMDMSNDRQRTGSVSIEDFSRMVSAIHAAAIDPEHWIAAMAAVRETFASRAAGVVIAEKSSRVIKSASLPEAAQVSYSDHYRQIDYVLDAVEHGPVGLIRGGEQLIALNARSEFNADWMRPHRMEDGLFVRLTDGPATTSFLVAAAKGHSESYATTERFRVVTALVPHLQQALRTQSLLADLVHRVDDVALAVDGIRHGVIVVGPRAAIVHLNRAAELTLSRGDGLALRTGILRAASPSQDIALQRAVSSALGLDETSTRTADSLNIPRSDGQNSYVVHVLPYTEAPTGGHEPRALVFLIDPEARRVCSADVLRRVYGLTTAEADVALHVADGRGIKPIADELSLSTATVKTHLQRVFLKTGTHRQAELVRLLLEMAA
jgi:DNA-binding CsgD family transcriptional regulator